MKESVTPLFCVSSHQWELRQFILSTRAVRNKTCLLFFNTTGYLILPFHSTKNGVSSQSEIIMIDLFSFIQEPGW